jgi:hypothetical protein
MTCRTFDPFHLNAMPLTRGGGDHKIITEIQTSHASEKLVAGVVQRARVHSI